MPMDLQGSAGPGSFPQAFADVVIQLSPISAPALAASLGALEALEECIEARCAAIEATLRGHAPAGASPHAEVAALRQLDPNQGGTAAPASHGAAEQARCERKRGMEDGVSRCVGGDQSVVVEFSTGGPLATAWLEVLGAHSRADMAMAYL